MGSIEEIVTILEQKISEFIKNKYNVLNTKEVDEILSLYNKVSIYSEEDTYNISEFWNPFKSYIRKTTPKLYTKFLKKKKYVEGFECIIKAIRIDMDNIDFINSILPLFKKGFFISEYEELCKLMFVQKSEPKYMEKIGDINYYVHRYNEAIDAYLNYAEISDPCPKLYKKMARVFDKLNDKESKQACINQAKILEGANG